MKIARLIIFVGCSLVFGLFVMLALGFSQMGDCFDVATCQTFKRHAALIVLGGGFVIWLVGALALVRRWSR